MNFAVEDDGIAGTGLACLEYKTDTEPRDIKKRPAAVKVRENIATAKTNLSFLVLIIYAC